MLNSIISKARSLTPRTGVLGAAAALIASFVFAPAAFAQAPMPSNGYVQSLGGTVKSGFGLCWRTGYWTPQMATEECDPDLVPKKAAPAPAAPPASVPAMVAPKPVEPPKPAFQQVKIAADVLFDFDSAKLKPAASSIMNELITNAKKLVIEAIQITGHADATGPEKYNQKLSERRAESVKQYMVDHGITSQRITTEGKGELQPIADNKTREGRAKNRRVEIVVVGKPAQ